MRALAALGLDLEDVGRPGAMPVKRPCFSVDVIVVFAIEPVPWVVNASLYGTEILGQCLPSTPDQGQDTAVLALVTTAMQNRQYSIASSRMAAIISQWNRNAASAATFYGAALPH